MEPNTPSTVEANNIAAHEPRNESGKASFMKAFGGSVSDRWNCELIRQAFGTVRVAHLDEDQIKRKKDAVTDALHGLCPQDEAEAMIAAQLIGAHNAAMECYRRGMISEQPLEGWKEALNQANKLSRTCASLLEALNRHRGKGQQKVTVEHVHVHSGGQAVVGMVETPGGRGST
jgi:hypothetical protein